MHTQEKFSAQLVNAKRQPEARRNARRSDNDRVEIHTVIDMAATKIRHLRAVHIRQHYRRHFAHGRRFARIQCLEFFVSMEQLREPDHQRVVAGGENRAVQHNQIDYDVHTRHMNTWSSVRTGWRTSESDFADAAPDTASLFGSRFPTVATAFHAASAC